MSRPAGTIALAATALSLLAVVLARQALSAGSEETAGAGFEGRAVTERLDDDPFVPRFRLSGQLLFRQAGGKTWVTPSNTILDGRSVPTLFVQLIGHPFESGFPKTAITYDHAVKSKHRSWEDTKRMFYEAAVSEGVDPVEAKVMYMLLRASGSRWALHGPNSCFSRCHVGEKELEWRPRVDDERLVALLHWIREEDPALDELDRRADEAVIEKGPHIFGVIR